MEIEISCPLGHKCEEAVTGKILRCAWYVEMRGTDATGQPHDDWKCAIAWNPILQTEMAGTNRGQTFAIESMREQRTKEHKEFMSVVAPIDQKALGSE